MLTWKQWLAHESAAREARIEAHALILTAMDRARLLARLRRDGARMVRRAQTEIVSARGMWRRFGEAA